MGRKKTYLRSGLGRNGGSCDVRLPAAVQCKKETAKNEKGDFHFRYDITSKIKFSVLEVRDAAPFTSLPCCGDNEPWSTREESKNLTEITIVLKYLDTNLFSCTIFSMPV